MFFSLSPTSAFQSGACGRRTSSTAPSLPLPHLPTRLLTSLPHLPRTSSTFLQRGRSVEHLPTAWSTDRAPHCGASVSGRGLLCLGSGCARGDPWMLMWSAIAFLRIHPCPCSRCHSPLHPALGVVRLGRWRLGDDEV